jgi:hypothetical protein
MRQTLSKSLLSKNGKPLARFNSIGDKPMDPVVLALRVPTDIREAVKSIPDWQVKLRAEFPALLEKWAQESKVST